MIEGVALCIILFFFGLLIEYFIGPPDLSFWSYPLNLIVGIAFLYINVTVYYFGKNRRWVQWLSGMPMSLTVILWILYLSLLVGLIPQSDVVNTNLTVSENLLVRFGFTHIVSSWFFLLDMALFLFVLGLVILRRLIMSFSWRNMAFILNHVGLWVALAGGILGAADRMELRMLLPLNGDVVKEAAEVNSNTRLSLPFGLELKNFILEEYPPKLALINSDGKYLPLGKPDIISVEGIGGAGLLGDWSLDVTKYLEEGVSGGTSEFRQADMRGGATALYVIATNEKKNLRYEGWVSAGNFMITPTFLPLEDENRYIVMLEREPKRFASELIVHKADGSISEAIVDVNSPFSIDGYDIYQSSYDQEKGRWSAYSGLMITADPVLTIVYVGLYMMLAGAILLFVFGPKKRIL